MNEYGPEKAGVGDSIPSLATMFSIHLQTLLFRKSTGRRCAEARGMRPQSAFLERSCLVCTSIQIFHAPARMTFRND